MTHANQITRYATALLLMSGFGCRLMPPSHTKTHFGANAPATGRAETGKGAGGVALTVASNGLVNGISCAKEPLDSIAYGTCGKPPSNINQKRSIPDVTIVSNDGNTSVTAITALAGAVASIKYQDQELIATGGHGSSFQFALHPYHLKTVTDPQTGKTTQVLAGTECDNPTEAGSFADDVDKVSPFLDQSSSGLVTLQSSRQKDGDQTVPQIDTAVNTAYFVPQNSNSEYAGDCQTYWAPNGPVAGTISNFYLTKHMTLGVHIGGQFFPNILKVNSTIGIPREVDAFDSTLVAYVSQLLKHELVYNPINDSVVEKTPGTGNKELPAGAGTYPTVRIYADDAGGTALGVMIPPDVNGGGKGNIYTTSNLDDPKPGYTHVFRIVAAQQIYGHLNANAQLTSNAYFIIGSVDSIKEAAKAFCKEQGSCGIAPPTPSVAFEANTGNLWGWDGNMGLGMASGTSPSIAGLADGRRQIAFQANTGHLWETGELGTHDLGFGMMAGTSPSIAGLSGGPYQIAFQANTGHLWVTGDSGTHDLGLGMRAGTSPSIAGLSDGKYQVAFQANTGQLWVTGDRGTHNLVFGMMPGTSPSIVGVGSGQYQIAFQANTGHLWVTGDLGTHDLGFGMMAGTSPAITSLGSGQYQVALQANTGDLWTTGSAGTHNLGLGMMAGTSPAITWLGGSKYQIAIQANSGHLWMAGDSDAADANLGMAAGSSPALTTIVPFP